MGLFARFWSTLGNFLWPVLLALVSLFVLGAFGYVATTRTFTPLESYSWQLFGIIVGFAGSAWFGRKSVQYRTKDLMPHARSAFRRLLSLYESISRVAYNIESAKNAKSREDYREILSEIKGLVFMQLAAASDALEDWRDIVPEDVAELERRFSGNNETEKRQ